MILELDRVDLRLLAALIEDGRIPFSRVAKEVGLSDVAVKKRFEKLVQRGIVKRIKAELDYSKLGFPHTIFILIRTEPQKTRLVMENLFSLPEVSEVHSVIGECNVIVKFVAESVADAKRIVEQIGRMDGVLELRSLISLENMEKDPKILEKLSQGRLIT